MVSNGWSWEQQLINLTKKLKSQKAKLVSEQAPGSCHIWFICRGNLIFARKGPGVDISVATELLNANVTTIGRKRVCLDNGNANASREKESIHSNIGNKDSEHAWAGGPSADRLYLDSDVSTDESESSPLSDLIGAAEYEDEKNVVFEESEHENVDSMTDEHKSPSGLTFRERGSILRRNGLQLKANVRSPDLIRH